MKLARRILQFGVLPIMLIACLVLLITRQNQIENIGPIAVLAIPVIVLVFTLREMEQKRDHGRQPAAR